ncbi:PREDICTED: fibroblast growth factor 22 isoform X1 [Cercocebus atys]|uniref:fibroblast growth factor 22 isoform X1 n=1 Tax=Cercocebus atys TaxID=9531 RepID=UPI0005F44C76|nr:PREDICTED: fibroblast growth factor 22 isoform X1 [Cercocebus atys]
MRRRLWLGLAWLLLARAPDAPGAPSAPQRTRSYPHLEGDVRWRRLFSSTHFFLRVDPGGRVQGTRWRHGQDSILEIRSVHVGVVVIKAVSSGFYVAMDRRGRLYGSVSAGQGRAARAGWGVRPASPPPAAALHCGLQVPGAHRRERPQHLRLPALAPPRPAHVPGTGQEGGAPARRPDAAVPPVRPLPARPGLLRPREAGGSPRCPGWWRGPSHACSSPCWPRKR